MYFSRHSLCAPLTLLSLSLINSLPFPTIYLFYAYLSHYALYLAFCEGSKNVFFFFSKHEDMSLS